MLSQISVKDDKAKLLLQLIEELISNKIKLFLQREVFDGIC